jgi:hypothetical protein
VMESICSRPAWAANVSDRLRMIRHRFGGVARSILEVENAEAIQLHAVIEMKIVLVPKISLQADHGVSCRFEHQVEVQGVIRRGSH